jgi:CDP-glucose 4,6-dehydratase
MSATPAKLFNGVYAGKKVFVTGHTGFKGSWLCEWLLSLGAEVVGYSLPPETRPNLFEEISLATRLQHHIGDVRDLVALRQAVKNSQPDFVFHLAAQALVRFSYEQPVETYAVNAMGTIHLLEALRDLKKPCAAVFITTDKCYENREWVYGYREEDPLGGHDPYSSSKAVAEIAISSWRRSFFKNHPVKIASARAGNVIGGGDWAKDRIIPDCIRALQAGQAITVRNKSATRPWQHVLEPLSGYLWLAARLAQTSAADVQVDSAFNFGPEREANRTVGELVEELLKHWPGKWEDKSDLKAVHEANWLHLTTDKASALLGWKPAWTFAEAIRQTVNWYHESMSLAPDQLHELTRRQIDDYVRRAIAARVVWAHS